MVVVGLVAGAEQAKSLEETTSAVSKETVSPTEESLDLETSLITEEDLTDAIGQVQLLEEIDAAASKETASSADESSDIEKVPLTMEEGLAKKISLDLRGMDIVDTIKFLSLKGGLNIVTSKNVSGRITLFLKDVTIADTLDVILLTNKLACEKKKNIITILTEVEYEALYGEKYTEKREIKTLKLKYIQSTKAGEALASIKSSIGKIIMDDATGSLILIDTPEKIREMESSALRLDEGIIEKMPPTITKVFELKYSQAEDLVLKVTEALTEGFGSARADERTNKIIVNDLPNKIEEITEMIATFDTQSKEIFIEAKIVEITLSDDFSFGVDWETMFKASSRKNIRITGDFPASGITSSYGRISLGRWREGFYTGEGTTSEAWNPGGLDPTQAQQILTFLNEVGKVKIVSSPHIVVCNNEEAKIMVGTRQPYATSTISNTDTASSTSWSAEFVDVGVTLTVTPTIYQGDFVKMHIKPEVSTLIDWFEIQDEAGTSQILLPEVDTSNAETTALIQDGKTVIIAGMIRETMTESEKKTPFLGDIPFLGKMFKSTYNTKEMKELVIFLTPRIISGDKDILYVEQIDKTKKNSKYYREGKKRRKPPRRKIRTEAL